MNFLVFVLLAIGISNDITATAGNLKVIRSSPGIATATSHTNGTPDEKISEIDLYKNGLEEATNTKVNFSNRKSKILRSLAFITGLSVGGLAGAASSDVKSYTKYSPVGLNVGASRISPHIAAIYDPYPYMSHPYIIASPLGFYSIWDPLRLQSINAIQNNNQPLPQNSQTSNLLDNRKPADLLNNDEEYVDEAKKVENVKAASNADENNTKSTEIQVENDRNAEEKVLSPSVTCNIPKQSSSLKSIAKERENTDGSLTTLGLRAVNTSDHAVSTNTTLKNTTQTHGTVPQNGTSTQNSTIDKNTTSPPFGYYGGYPQNINHIDLTTNAYEHKYHDYEHINYNVPSYDKPINFYSDDRYNYYHVPPVDSYPSSQYQQDQIPEYFSNDFKRFVYTSDNNPPFINSDFRPVA